MIQFLILDTINYSTLLNRLLEIVKMSIPIFDKNKLYTDLKYHFISGRI